ncbi:bifunctional 5,10-methylene-tetrahydrofolate dehydrogenase/5,10-methylene-tetrahydrofolate cyclohydrolase [Paenibacillus elgii]|uniref:Bifunctional protein FolD n=1 Tax=Paenibacillus elgii TaxID=189691 RepID=A0A2T6G6Q5_9BACL|nr:bifunctional 5,10-methylenetetrahydrofolate dehydrogenase/5,10-methenyltetrahydrofolate cyclohydrolase [Paenibacillus elgii]PUA39826.1 bifunctional 5,10-methylene-tetrahydrofolate dehydrogenase/5,10-methylene-tetrahydrofolate cyclohydrolase [Paenibacillus elgii]
MAQLLKAKEAADQVYERILKRTEEWKAAGCLPCMGVILVEGDPASLLYVRAKQKIAGRLGIAFQLKTFRPDAQESEVMRLIAEWNADSAVHGIMLELPLPKHWSQARIESAIAPQKDVDGVTPANKLATMTGLEGLYPATPQACIRLLRHYGYRLEGANVALIGRGQTVGLPLFHMLQREQATVTVCHSRTPDLAFHLRHAEVAFAAAGQPGLVTREMVHPELVLIDAGINESADGSIAGDVSAGAAESVKAVSPVPGGVGTLTTAILFENVLKALELQAQGKVAGR